MNQRPTFTRPSGSDDAERIQSALIGEPVDDKPLRRENTAHGLERLGPRLFGVVCVASAAAAVAKHFGWL